MAVAFGSAAVTASGPTITLPSHSTGDLIVIVATKGGSGTIPSLPAGWTSAFTASAADSVRVGWKIAASGAETSGTWTNAEDLAAAVYSGADQVGAVAWATTTGLPALTLDVTSGSSWVMAATWNATTPATPTGMTSRATGTYARVADTNAGVSSWSAQGAYAMDFGAVVEIRETAIDLAPADLASAASLDAVAVTQVHNVTVADLTSAGTLDVAEHATTWTGWAGFIGSSEYATAVTAKSRTVGAWVEMVDTTGTAVPLAPTGTTIAPLTQLPVESGSVEFRGEQAEQWSCRLVITDERMVPKSVADALDPRSGLRARVWWRIRYTNAWNAPTWGDVPVGTYYLEDPSITDDGSSVTVTVTGRDPLTIARRGGYGGAPLDLGGVDVGEAIRAIFDRVAPTLPLRVADTDVTVPATYVVGAQDPAQDWTDLARLAGWVVRTDPMGVIVAGPRPEPAASTLDWQEGPSCVVTAVQRDLTTSNLFNRVTVRSTSPDVLPVIYATDEDDDPGSPTWVGGTWGVHPAPDVESDAIATQAGADNLARMMLGRYLHPTEDVEVTVPQRGDLGYRDVATIKADRAGIGGEFRVSSWTLDLPRAGQPPAPMRVRMMTRTAL